MPERDDIHRAEEAKRLMENEVLVQALTDIGDDALLALADADATNTKEIQRLQAIAHVVRELPETLHGYILRTGEHDGGVSLSVVNGPQETGE